MALKILKYVYPQLLVSRLPNIILFQGKTDASALEAFARSLLLPGDELVVLCSLHTVSHYSEIRWFSVGFIC